MSEKLLKVKDGFARKETFYDFGSCDTRNILTDMHATSSSRAQSKLLKLCGLIDGRNTVHRHSCLGASVERMFVRGKMNFH